MMNQDWAMVSFGLLWMFASGLEAHWGAIGCDRVWVLGSNSLQDCHCEPTLIFFAFNIYLPS